jgi:hypothetical protein
MTITRRSPSLTLALLFFLVQPHSSWAQRLSGWAILPPDTFVAGPDSGQFIDPPITGLTPFIGRQPVQGVSSVVGLSDGGLIGLLDNGFGRTKNSADFLLRCYRFRPDYPAQTVAYDAAFFLRDPASRLGRPIVAELSHYQQMPSVPVPKGVREQRILTGKDLDPESIALGPDGGFWVGDEFGPSLLHFDQHGVLLEKPYLLDGIRAPQWSDAGQPATVVSSGGFEAMALDSDGRTLLLMLEKPRPDVDDQTLPVFRFDIEQRRFLDSGPYRSYPIDPATTGVGAMGSIGPQQLMVLERDSSSGPDARHKKLYLVDLSQVDGNGLLKKKLLLDLMNIPDPDHVYGESDRFALPLHTLESVLLLDQRRVLIVNDNNYPFGSGRKGERAGSEGTEFVVVEFPRALKDYGK